MNEYEKRKHALRLRLAGEKITNIVILLFKNRPWFYSWLERYQAANGEGKWFEDQSRAPKNKPTKVSEAL